MCLRRRSGPCTDAVDRLVPAAREPPPSGTVKLVAVLAEDEWRAREAAHHARVDALTAGHLDRRRRGEKHVVNDFLFDYYGFSPAKLRRWHPGVGVALAGASSDDRAGWKFMRVAGAADVADHAGAHSAADAPLPPGTVALDAAAFLAARGSAVAFVRVLLARTLERPMQTACFGLHEWAMVYRQLEARRHEKWPLRLGSAGTDAVLEASTLRCTHFDATRFFTPEGLARNTQAPARDTMVDFEQPGCVHAGMDVYRWAFKLAPAVPSELIADTFELALQLRTLDMQASPYDLRDLGYEPVPIETPEGRKEYAARQRALGEQANALRRRLLDALEPLGPVARQRATVERPALATA